MNQKIYLIRHTTPQVEKGMIYGQTDLGLTETFWEEAEAIKSVVPQHQEIPLYSSPLQRCHQLAQALVGAKLNIDDRLKELNFGDWEMKKWEEVERTSLDFWLKNIKTESTPNGESNAQLYERSVDFWEEFLAKDYEQAGIVTHWGVIQSILSHLLHIPMDKAFRIDLSYGCVIQVSIQQKQYYKIKFLK